MGSIRVNGLTQLMAKLPRDAKGELEKRMSPTTSYSPTVDQARMTAHFDLAVAYRRCRSFRKLVSAFGSLATSAGVPPTSWPPAGWESRDGSMGG